MAAPASALALFGVPTVGFLLALLVLVVSLWLTEAIAPNVALPLVALVLIGVAVTRPGLTAQLRSLVGG